MIEPNGSNFARFFAYRAGRLLGITGKRTSKFMESPIQIQKVMKILGKLGFRCQVWPSRATITIYSKLLKINSDFQFRFFAQYLNLASHIFPNIFGSSDFILIGLKER